MTSPRRTDVWLACPEPMCNHEQFLEPHREAKSLSMMWSHLFVKHAEYDHETTDRMMINVKETHR